MVEFFENVSLFFHQLFIDVDTLGKVMEWAKKLPDVFGSIHPILQLGFVLFGVFLTLKIIIHLL